MNPNLKIWKQVKVGDESKVCHDVVVCSHLSRFKPMRCLNVFAHHECETSIPFLYNELFKVPLWRQKSWVAHVVLFLGIWNLFSVTSYSTNPGGSILGISFSIYISSNNPHGFNTTCKLMASKGWISIPDFLLNTNSPYLSSY